MEIILGSAVLGLAAFFTATVPFRPTIAVVLFLGMYPIEQILFRVFGVFFSGSAFNYFIGGVVVLATVVSLLRSGIPKIAVGMLLLILMILVLTSLSLYWTSAPRAGGFAVSHYLVEAGSATALGLLVIRGVESVRYIWLSLVALAFLISVFLIVCGVPSIGGRTALLEGGTVLSPAKIIGLGVIACFVPSRAFSPLSANGRLIMGGTMLLALFLLGTRGQLIFALLSSLIGAWYAGAFTVVTKQAFITAILMVVGLLAYGFEPVLQIDKISGAASRFEAGTVDYAFGSRWESLVSCLTLDAPIFGHGVMSWAYETTGADVYLYPHNSLAQAFFEIGLVGLFLFLTIFLYPLVRSFSLRRSVADTPLHSSSVAILLSFLTSVSYTHLTLPTIYSV